MSSFTMYNTNWREREREGGGQRDESTQGMLPVG